MNESLKKLLIPSSACNIPFCLAIMVEVRVAVLLTQRTSFASPNGQVVPDAILWLSLTCKLLSSRGGNALAQERIKFSGGR